MSHSTQSTRSPRISRQAKIAAATLFGIVALIYIVAISLIIFTVRSGENGAIPPQSTPVAAVTTTPAPDQPTVVVSPDTAIPGMALAVSGSNWASGEPVTVFLRDPAQPAEPLLFLSTGAADTTGLVVVNVNYPTDPRWANLNQVDVVMQSQRTSVYVFTPLKVQPGTPTASATPDVILVPTRVPPTVTATRPSPTLSPTPTPTRVTPTATRPPYPDWRGEYFANTMLLGTPVIVRNDPDVNFNWGRNAPAPGLPVDNFSARWTRQLSFPATQAYRFVLRADDGVRLWIDGLLILDEWHTAAATAYTRDVNLTAGWHAFRIEYYEGSGDAAVQFRIESVPQTFLNWKGEYFPNKSLSGLPALTRNDIAISFDWGQGAPAAGLPVDGFSVRWTRTLQLDAGVHRFSLRSDDGVRLWIDGILLIDEWHNSSGTTFTRDVQLAAGNHAMQIEYFENTGGASIYFSYQRVEDFTKWRGEYYPNDQWAGAPVLVRNDDRLDFDWGQGSPDPLLPSDHFSVRWTRAINLDAGTYRFDLIADDGVRFWIDNVLVLDKVQQADNATYSLTAALTAGQHTFRLDYVEYTGRARFSWTRTFLGGPTFTYTPTPTATNKPPTFTFTPTFTATPTQTPSPTVTPTFTFTPTPTETPTVASP